MGYDAASSIEQLAYDFTAVGGPKGAIPEPSQERVDAFREQLRTLFGEAGIRDVDVQSLDGMADESARELHGKLMVALADLCDGHPSGEEIAALPPRHQAGFFKYVAGELMDPTEQRAASRRSPVRRNGVASGI